MHINYLFGFQIATDVIICLGILFLLIRFRKFFKPGLMEISEKTIEEFSQLLAESRNAANKFLEELEQEKNALNQLATFIDEREKRLKELINQANLCRELSPSESAPKVDKSDSFSEEHSREILSLARKGLSEGEISRQLGLPEGEIDLILNLSRAKRK
jgi:hypothetical protein